MAFGVEPINPRHFMEELFRVNRSILQLWFSQKGRSGNINEMILQHFNSLGGIKANNCGKEAIQEKMRALGFGAGMNSREALDKFFINKMSNTNPTRAQELFFASQSNEFN